MNTPDAPRNVAAPAWMRIGIALTVILCAFAAFVVGLFWWSDVQGRRAWEVYRREALARGVKLDFKDFIPPPVPDEDNVAMAPVFSNMLATSWDWEESPFHFETGTFNSHYDIPVNLALLAKQLLEAGDLGETTSEPAQDVLYALGRFEQPLADVAEALRRPQCRWPIDWSQGYSVAFLKHLPELRRISLLIRARATCHLNLGQRQPALDDLALLGRLREVAGAGPGLTLAMSSAAIVPMELGIIQEGLIYGVWTDEDLRRFEIWADGFDFRALFGRAFESDRAGQNSTFDRIAANPARELGFLRSQDNPFRGRIYPVGWVRDDQVLFNQVFDEKIGDCESHAPFFTLRTNGVSVATRDLVPNWTGRHALLEIMNPNSDWAIRQFASSAFRIEALRVACAIERHRRLKGGLPGRLDELVPDFLAAVPVNPDGGGPLLYTREPDGGYTLTTAGPFSLADRRLFSRPDAYAYRWVWRMPAQPVVR